MTTPVPTRFSDEELALIDDLVAQGVAESRSALIRQAIQADPLTAAVATLPKISEMVDELFAENAEYVKDWPA